MRQDVRGALGKKELEEMVECTFLSDCMAYDYLVPDGIENRAVKDTNVISTRTNTPTSCEAAFIIIT